MQGNMNSTSYLRQTITISAAEIALKPLKKKKKKYYHFFAHVEGTREMPANEEVFQNV